MESGRQIPVSDGDSAPFQVASANARATGVAVLVTRCDVHTLVPEPGAVALSVLGAMLLLRRRRDQRFGCRKLGVLV